ncbi:MAG: hypothetical protein WCE52_13110 [Candidatus Acidiferrum sp.]
MDRTAPISSCTSSGILSQPATRNPQPATRNPQPATRNPQPATRNPQDHVCDIKTLQNWMGHKDLASTMVYLKAVRNKDVMARVNSSELAAVAI